MSRHERPVSLLNLAELHERVARLLAEGRATVAESRAAQAAIRATTNAVREESGRTLPDPVDLTA